MNSSAGAQVLANGGNGGSGTAGSFNSGAGGGGAGGAVYLRAPVVRQDGTVSAVGGVGGRSNLSSTVFDAGDGGLGRIRVDADTLLVGGAAASQAQFNQTCDPDVGFYGVFDGT